jgi:hypothetical protein
MENAANVLSGPPIPWWSIAIAIAGVYLSSASLLFTLVQEDILNWLERKLGWPPRKIKWLCVGAILVLPLVGYLVAAGLVRCLRPLMRGERAPPRETALRFRLTAYAANLARMRAFRSLFGGHFVELETEIFPDSPNQHYYREVFARLLEKAQEMVTIATATDYLWSRGSSRYVERLTAICSQTQRVVRILEGRFLPASWYLAKAQAEARHLHRMTWNAWEQLQELNPSAASGAKPVGTCC